MAVLLPAATHNVVEAAMHQCVLPRRHAGLNLFTNGFELRLLFLLRQVLEVTFVHGLHRNHLLHEGPVGERGQLSAAAHPRVVFQEQWQGAPTPWVTELGDW